MSEKNDEQGVQHGSQEKKEVSQKTKRILNAPIYLRVWEVQGWLYLDCTGCGEQWKILAAEAEDKEPYGFTKDHLNKCPGYSSAYSQRKNK